MSPLCRAFAPRHRIPRLIVDRVTKRFFGSTILPAISSKGLVLGVYAAPDKTAKGLQGEISSTSLFQHFDAKFNGILGRTLVGTGYFDGNFKKGKVRVFHGLDQEYGTVIVVSLGVRGGVDGDLEKWDSQKENVRAAAGAAAIALRDLYVTEADVDTLGDAESAAEGSILRLFSYDELKHKDKRKRSLRLHPLVGEGHSSKTSSNDRWSRGVTLAEGQNYARSLMETPANLKVPKVLADRIASDLAGAPGLSVTIRDEKWVEEKGMGAFRAVSQGSDEPLRLVEISYTGRPDSKDVDVAVVGKGITFDTGGISIKPSLHMDLMRGDMGGAASTAASIWTASKLGIPINLIGIIPIAENMPSGKATRPGDVVRAMNGKTIQVDNTDAEGRLILADALCYAQEFKPRHVIDLATLTGAIRVALGNAAAGVFSNDEEMWALMSDAGVRTGDRVWRMPLFQHYADEMTDSLLADLNNVGKYAGGGSCTAAGFLAQFIGKGCKWMHMDIAGVSENKSEVPYLGKGFSGRPTRSLVEFFRQLSMKQTGS
ncbi:Cytosol aminopeptidase [Hypsibius exemplaris]|uniref:Cytosol aminopeptidase n=1 Tax=Hypsibius exemplaris TaxID=2072580 RepID=A0A1W0XD36_HYPEX|nr:Cytosol aminopeptidase [Hypsibius exemplaris]